MTYTEETTLFSCEGESLVGILAKPAAPNDTGVVLIVGGPQTRVGSHRQFVLLSRALAANGYAVLRFDYRGMGDSSGAQRDFEGVSADIAAAINTMQARVPEVKHIALWGLCDGASAALLYCHATQDPRIAGLCLLNPWVRSEASLAKTQVKHYYAQRLRQKEFWFKLLSGKVALSAMSGFAAKLRQSAANPSQRQNEAGTFQQRMAVAWHGFGGRILLVLSGDDYTAKEFLEYANADPAWQNFARHSDLRRHDIAGADHTFSNAAARQHVERITLEWICRPLMQYQRFDATGCGFPQPKVPVLPALSRAALGRRGVIPFRVLGASGNAQSYTRGRYALAEAYRLAGVGPDTAILLPAYHCRTMLDPAIRLGAHIVLYPLQRDLAPDLNVLSHCLAQSQHPVKAMLLTHYFGFAQSLAPIVNFCEHHHITLIEDCSHALFTSCDSAANATNLVMGEAGQYGVASPYKFIPIEDGGLLWANTSAAPRLPRQTPPPLKRELKGIVHALLRARVTGPAASHDAFVAIPGRRSIAPASPSPAGHDTWEYSPTTSHNYHAREERQQSLAGSRWIMRHTNLQRLVERRRAHYQQWASAVASLPHCRALHAELPAESVPYMFPLLIDQPELHFFALKRLGMPIWRWDDMAVSGCDVAADYRLQLLHLPCHQELSAEQMDWMIRTVQQVMRQLERKIV